MHSLSLVVCFITILTSSACQVTDEAEKTSEPATCIYKGYEDEVYDLTSLANTNGKPRCAYIMLTLLSFFHYFQLQCAIHCHSDVAVRNN